MSRGATFVRFYPSDWRSGCIGLTLEEEGLYARICAHFYETGNRLSLDDDVARCSIGGLDIRKYRRVRDGLISKGKLHECQDGYTVPRAELELARARSAIEGDQAKEVGRVATARAGHGMEHEDRGVALAGEQERSADAVASNELVTEVFDKSEQSRDEVRQKNQSFLRATKEPRTNSQTPSARASGNSFWKNALNPQADHGVELLEGGRLQLVNGTRAEWLEKFGGDAVALDLALGEIIVQSESREGLRKQVERQLSRIARMRHDSDRRYQQSKTAPKQSDQPVHRVSPDVVRFAKPKLEPQPWEPN